MAKDGGAPGLDPNAWDVVALPVFRHLTPAARGVFFRMFTIKGSIIMSIIVAPNWEPFNTINWASYRQLVGLLRLNLDLPSHINRPGIGQTIRAKGGRSPGNE